MSTENQATTYRTRSNRKKFLMGSGLSALAGCFMMSAAAAQKPAEPVKEFHIAAQSLDAALKSYAFTTNKQVMFTTDIVEGKQATPVEGEMTDAEALQKLLAGSGLVFETRNTNVILVRTAAQQQAVVNQGGGTVVVEEIERGDPSIEEDTAGADAKKRDEITVTGTLIKGIAPESSPVQTFDREDILESGALSSEEFLRRAVLQNFGGGSTEFAIAGVPNDVNSQRNFSFGTGANLRGLGSGATLTLLDGKRLAPSSSLGDFVDLSIIPLSAIQRVDVLTDGASSIYGADAVAGVVNFVLRKDFDGAETVARYGTVTEGDMREFRVGQTLGTYWSGGNILASYEFYDRDNLTLADRPGIPLPTNISGEEVPHPELLDLLPEQRKHNALLTFNQDFGGGFSFSATGVYSKRAGHKNFVSNTSGLYIQETDVRANSFAVSSSIDYEITTDWSATITSNYSKLRDREFGQRIEPLGNPYEYITDSKLWSVDGIVNGAIAELPGGSIRVAVGGQFRRETFEYGASESAPSADSSRSIWAAFGEAFIPIISSENASAFAKRLEINVSSRMDRYSDFGSTVNPKVGLLFSPYDGLNFRGSYATAFAPAPLGRIGGARYAEALPYSLVASVFGIPLNDPALGDVDYMQVYGTDARLDPEESRTFTAGMDFSREFKSQAFSLSASFYDIRFSGRLNTTPVPGNLNAVFAPSLAFDNPALFPDDSVIFFPSADIINDTIDGLTRPLELAFGATVENIGIINRVTVTRNLARTATQGIDLNLEYSVENTLGRFSAGFSTNYILQFSQQAAPTTPVVETVSTLYNPVDLQLRGNVGFAREGFRSKLFVNRTGSYRSDTTQTSEEIDSWTTFDLSLAYEVAGTHSAFLNGFEVNLSVVNLLDKEPPETPTYGALRLAGYDPTNASPIGRFITFGVRKHF